MNQEIQPGKNKHNIHHNRAGTVTHLSNNINLAKSDENQIQNHFGKKHQRQKIHQTEE